MPAYSYEALDSDGKTRKGVLEADSVKAARSQLRTQKLVPIVVGTLGVTKKSVGDIQLMHRPAFNGTQKAVLSRQLAGLVSAGLPLERALHSLSEEAETEEQRDLMATIRSEVNSGSSFSRALAQHPTEFSPIFVAVIGAGENSGKLGLVLERLADELEEQQNLQAKVMGAAIYPIIVSVIAVVIVLFLLAYVVPQVATVFAGSKRALPVLTSIMLSISGAVRTYGWFILLMLFLATVGARYALAQPAFRERFDSAWLQLPVIGKLSRGYNAARFASTLAMLGSAGVPILKSIQAAAETLSNSAMRADAMQAMVLVREGAPLANALVANKRFPPLLGMFARLGEQTGQLPEMLDRAAVQLRSEVQRRAMQLATILEPLLIVFMGIAVMLIVLAVLQPILQMNQLVK